MQIQVFSMTTQAPDPKRIEILKELDTDQAVENETLYTPHLISQDDVLYIKRERKHHQYEIKTMDNEILAFPSAAYMVPHLSLIQVDRGIYVNLNNVKQLNDNSELVLVNGDTVPVSLRKLDDVKNLLTTK
ncbi:LytTR family transcriptional regulator DNA-binding domain-containing protein [Paenibacillus sp. LS1]|uniref:LytTR family DNA-binding domain-containing protein n=1 Tax=Paenibacillus sp. LS1 TaxID=2992120 RepID=UPI0022306C44|nr:LytTR family DNA-binding domain-containing protein [Paenibacillus sp. LS1]MCW3793976.1 LytTR family transcriptional regulator DNA-binding domain-containing protein [Paenibacillus sp. LS1]